MNLPAFLTGGDREAPFGDQLYAGFCELRDESQLRVGRYRDAEARYERSRDTAATSLGDHDDYGRPDGDGPRRRHNIPLNLEHAITQKHAFRIAGRQPDILVPGNDRSRTERFRSDTMEQLIYGAYRYSDIDSQWASGGHHGSLLGASCYDVWLDSGLQIPRVRELHPGSVLVVPGIEDVHDFEAVYRFWSVSLRSLRAKYGNRELPYGCLLDDLRPDEDSGTRGTLVELVTRTERIRFCGKVALETIPHNYGFAPYVVIPNLGPLEQTWGYSDFEFYKDAAAYLEKIVSRQADVAATTANGAMQDLGSGNDTTVVQRVIRLGGVLGGRKDSKGVVPIQPPEFGAWIDGHIALIRQIVNDTSFSPDAAWGTLGSSTSGSDRALQLGPQLELTGLKQIHWSGGIKRINTMILKLIEKYTTDATFRGTRTKGYRTAPFTLVVNAAAAAASEPPTEDDVTLTDVGPDGAPRMLPQTPAQLIDGDYCTEVVWNNRLDRDDPNFVLSELNKYAQAAQSLYTTLERLGFANPEDEIKLIAAEAEKYPWLRSGMIALIQQQIDAAAGGGGQPSGAGGGSGDLSAGLASLLGGGGGGSGALTFDALSSGLNGKAQGGQDRPTRVTGSPYGGA